MAIVLVKQYFSFTFEPADKIYTMKLGEVVYESKNSSIEKLKLHMPVGV